MEHDSIFEGAACTPRHFRVVAGGTPARRPCWAEIEEVGGEPPMARTLATRTSEDARPRDIEADRVGDALANAGATLEAVSECLAALGARVWETGELPSQATLIELSSTAMLAAEDVDALCAKIPVNRRP